MGVDLERKRRQNEKRLRDKQLQENLMSNTLFSAAPETYLTHFRCESGKQRIALQTGDPLLIRDARGRVEILKSGIQVGHMSKADADGLRGILAKESRAAGICLGEVVQCGAGEESFRIKIRPVNPKAGEVKIDGNS